MAGRQAKVITPGMLRRMPGYVRRSRYPRRNRVIVLLGVKAGLRACEIASLEWSMVLDGGQHWLGPERLGRHRQEALGAPDPHPSTAQAGVDRAQRGDRTLRTHHPL